MNKNILIAGGTGLVGSLLMRELEKRKFTAHVLTRNSKQVDEQRFFYWNPAKNELNYPFLNDVHIIINLSGAGIADKRWTEKRKVELIQSRILPAQFLAKQIQSLTHNSLEHYISASGINCYPMNNSTQILKEEDAFGNDFLSTVVQQWEQAADTFLPICKVAKLRISAVFSSQGGALEKMSMPIRYFVGAPLGTGKQIMSWIHEEDLIRAFLHTITHQLEGAYNLSGEQATNKQITKEIAKALHRPLIPIGIPAFILKLLLGSMSEMLIKGMYVNTSKFKQTGFIYEYPTSREAIQHLISEKNNQNT
jgi:uncharacterized protein